MSSSVEDIARSAMENLIKELQKERDVSSKERTLRMDLINQLTDYETQKQRRVSEIKDLHSKIALMETRIQELMDTIQSYETSKDSDNTGETDIKKDDSASATVSGEDTSETDTNSDDSKSGGNDAAAITITESVSEDSEPTVAEVEPTEEKKESESSGPEINKVAMSERRRFLIQVRMILRLTFRGYFGLSFSNRWGYWLDRFMSTQIHSYADWIEYSKGDQVLSGHASSVFSLAASNDGYCLFTGSSDGNIIAYDLTKDRMIRKWQAHDSTVYGLSCAANDRLLASGSESGLINIWTVSHLYKLITTLKGHSNAVKSVCFSSKSDQLLSASADCTIRLWDVKKRQIIREFIGHSVTVESALFIDDQMIISGSQDKTMKIWKIQDGSELKTIREGINNQVYNVSVNCNVSQIACFAGYRGCFIYQWPDMKLIRQLNLTTLRGCFHPTKPNILAVACNYRGNVVWLYHSDTGETIKRFEGHTANVLKVCFSPNGERMMSVSNDCTARIWDVSQYILD